MAKGVSPRLGGAVEPGPDAPPMDLATADQPSTTGAAPVLAWTIGAAPVVARVATHGSAGRSAAIIIAMLTAGLALVLASAPLRDRATVWSSVMIVVLAELLTVGLVGRAPALVACAGVLVAAFSLGITRQRPWSEFVGSGALLAAVGSVGWAATGATVWLAAWGASGAVTWYEQRAQRGTSTQVLAPRSIITWLAERRDLVLVALCTAAIAAPVFHRLASDAAVVVRGVNDFDDHYERVVPLAWSPFKLTAPHPLFHVATKWLEMVTGSAAAMTLIMMAALSSMAVTLTLLARSERFGWRPLHRGWAYALPTIYLLGASPAVLLNSGDSWWNRSAGFDVAGRGAGFFPLHIWGSPTLTLSMAMYLALVPLVLRLIEDHDNRALRVQVLVLTVAVCLTSPSGALGLAPGLVLLLLIRHARGGSRSTLFAGARAAGWFVVPAAAVVAWQMWFLATSQSPLEETTWRFNPFWMVEHFEMDRPAFWALLLIPAAGVLVTGRRFLNDPAIRWCGLGFVVSLFPTFLLQETGWKSTHGGLAMTTFVCASLLAAFTIRLVLVELQSSWCDRATKPLPASHRLAALILLLVLTAGIADYLTAVGVLDFM